LGAIVARKWPFLSGKEQTGRTCYGILFGEEAIGVNTRLKKLMKELGDAINGTLSESDQIAQVIAKIKEEGYDIFLVLEATIGFNRREEQEGQRSAPELVGTRRKSAEPEFSITAHDVRFLKSLRISVDDAA
jgi:hypothetical protein